MRKLLRNRAFVSVMVVCAILAVGGRMQTYWRPGFMQGFARETEALVPPMDATHPLTPSVPSSHVHEEPWPDYRTNLVDWPNLFPVTAQSRDPFAASDPNWEPVPEGNSADALPDGAQFVLQAVSVQPEQALAVINHQTYGTGEQIGEFTVEKIRAHEVWLKHPRGRHVLSLKFGVPETSRDSQPSTSNE